MIKDTENRTPKFTFYLLLIKFTKSFTMYKYLIIGSDCYTREVMDRFSFFQRIPGPIDNCILLDPMGIDYILSGEYLEDIKKQNFKASMPSCKHHEYNFNLNDKILVVHNDITSKEFLNHSIERIENFKNNIFNENIYLCMGLTNYISTKVENFKELFKKYPNLERVNFFTIERPYEKVAIENFDFFNSYNLIDGRNKLTQNFLKMLTHKKSNSII